MSKRNEIKLDKEAVISAAIRVAEEGSIERACDAALVELTDQLREHAPTLPDEPWDAIAAMLGAYVTTEARGNQSPLAAYDAARAALRTLPSFGEMSARVGRELRREPTYDDSVVIVTTLDAVSRGLVETLRLPVEPEQTPIGIPDPPPPPPTKAVDVTVNEIATMALEDVTAIVKEGIRNGSDASVIAAEILGLDADGES